MRIIFTLLFFASFTISVQAQTVTKWAGKVNSPGGISAGTTLANVRLNKPWGMTYDANGNIYVTNEGSHTIYMYNKSDGKFYPRAGKLNTRGKKNDFGINATFDSPRGIAVGSKVYIADAGNHTIRQMDNFSQVSTSQEVTLLAGKAGTSGHNDATGSAAEFDTPSDVAVDSKGNIYVADAGNHCIRMISSAGVVTTYAGDPGISGLANGDKDTKAKFFYPTGLYIDSSDNIYVADKSNSRIRFIEKSSGSVSTVFKDLWTPEAVLVDSSGSIITSHGCQISGLNGADTFFVGKYPRIFCGYKNDNDTNALLDGAKAILQISAFEYLFCDQNNNAIRKFELDACGSVKANISANGALEFCEGNSVDLSGVSGATNSWTWKNGTSPNSTITADKTGWYSLEVSKTIGNSNCSDTTGVFVKVNANPTPSIKGALSFCPGGSTDLSADQSYSKYDWSTNESTQTITVSSAVTIELTVTDANGCSGSASSVQTSIYSTTDPSITPSGATEFCEGGSVDLEASSGFTSYLWSNNNTGNKITVDASGTFSVTATDNNGCETSSSEITINVNPLPAKPDIASENDSIYTTAIASSYKWFKDGNEVGTSTNPYFIASESGLYTVEVTDENGCFNSSAEENVTIVGIDHISKGVKVFPNPANDYLIVLGAGNFNFVITDITGKRRLSGFSKDKISLPSLPSGTYFVQVNGQNGKSLHRIVVVQ
ncbi:MAG: T9SS type A sorting domain-containing protein [Bacteroidia bacterium]